MDNKELRKLGRKDLLEIILAQTKRIEELETELKKTNSELNSKKIAIEQKIIKTLWIVMLLITWMNVMDAKIH